MDDQTYENVAVFLGRTRLFTGVTVKIADGALSVWPRFVTPETTPMVTYQLVETAKVGMAWDVMADIGLSRVVAQTGCGCGGMNQYTVDSGYSGALPA